MNTSKNRILDAAEQIILRDGVARLTLEAVAAEAALSKGGVLYHYRSKDELIRGMIARLQERFEAEMRRLEAEDPCPTGRRARAYFRTALRHRHAGAGVCADELATALLAAVSTNPSLLDPLHERALAIRDMLLQDGLEPSTAMVVQFAADGLWLSGLFGVPPLARELRAGFISKLEQLSSGV